MSTTTLFFIAIPVALVLLCLRFLRVPVTPPDEQVIAQLRGAGSDISRPHDLDFFLYFPAEAAARQAATELATRGFVAEVRADASGADTWVVQAKRTMVPEPGALTALRQELSALAAAGRGQYDGWGAAVVR